MMFTQTKVPNGIRGQQLATLCCTEKQDFEMALLVCDRSPCWKEDFVEGKGEGGVWEQYRQS